MRDFLRDVGNSARVQAALTAWLPPLLLAAFVFAVVLQPELKHTFLVEEVESAAKRLDVNVFLFEAIALVALAFFLSMNRTLIYKVLEGEAWWPPLADWRRKRAHVPYARYLRAVQERARGTIQLREVEHLTPADPERLALAAADIERTDVALAQAAKLCQRRGRKTARPWRRRPLFCLRFRSDNAANAGDMYPASDEAIMATTIGNRLKVAETYGANTYGLDSQIMWYDLYTEATDALRGSIDETESRTDTLVCSLLATTALLLCALGAAIWRSVDGRSNLKLWIALGVSLSIVPIIHRGILAAVDEWAAAIRALVNNGRSTLRLKHQMPIPQSPQDERDIWEAVVGFEYYGAHPYYAERLEKLRARALADEVRRTQAQVGVGPATKPSTA